MLKDLKNTIGTNQPGQVLAKREQVRQAFLKSTKQMKEGRVTSLAPADLHLLFVLYDRIFFSGLLGSVRLEISFSISRRMTKSAGKTIFRQTPAQAAAGRGSYEIRLGADFFFNYDQAAAGSGLVCGIRTKDSLEALLIVFEHELCHVLERLAYGTSSCARERFKKLAADIFAHRSSRHELASHGQLVAGQFGFKVGDQVAFEYRGVINQGVVNKITKRATVMVRHEAGDYQDRAGRRYKKYYVPLSQLWHQG